MNKDGYTDVSVLYVEDEAATREQMYSFLSRHMREVSVAVNGKEAIGQYQRKRHDIIVTDIRMPVMDGLELSRMIKEIDPESKIIITSAYSDTDYLLTAIERGIDAYVIKPIDVEKLLSAINKCAEVILYRKSLLRHQEEQRKTMEELKAALSKVKQLSGFLPICASCKKIRDDRGYWQQIEEYIRDHSEAEFSHGLCPDCAKKIYPQYFPKTGEP
jgi:YesN/AraC family two-component response regulator